MLSVSNVENGGRSTFIICPIWNLSKVRPLLSKQFRLCGLLCDLLYTFGDLLANWAKRNVRRGFCDVSINSPVGSAMRHLLFTKPGGRRESFKEDCGKLVSLCDKNCKHKSMLAQICPNSLGCAQHTAVVAIQTSDHNATLVRLIADGIFLS